MGKKSRFLFIASGILLCLGLGLWAYQANLFEKSVRRQVSALQGFLHSHGATLVYDDFKFSPYFFKARLINPSLSGLIPADGNYLKYDTRADYFIKGEFVISFSPFANTVRLASRGENHVTVEGPLDLKFSTPANTDSEITIHRRTRDFSGQNPFINLHNIKQVSSKEQNVTLFLNHEKLMDIKTAEGKISLDKQGNALDAALESVIQGMEWFAPVKPLEGKIDDLDSFNEIYRLTLAKLVLSGLEDQKIFLTFHVNNIDGYIKDIKTLIIGQNWGDIEKIFPEGLSVQIKEYSTNNKVWDTSIKSNLERNNNLFTMGISLDFKAKEGWDAYWPAYFEEMLTTAGFKGIFENIKSAENRDLIEKLRPRLQDFGPTHLAFTLKTPVPLSLTAGNASFNFKSDLYKVALKGKLAPEGSFARLKTLNALQMTQDFENYATRFENLEDSLTHVLAILKIYLQAGNKILGKVLEPSGSAKQQVDIRFNPAQGIEVGKYKGQELLAMFIESVTPQDKALNPPQ